MVAAMVAAVSLSGAPRPATHSIIMEGGSALELQSVLGWARSRLGPRLAREHMVTRMGMAHRTCVLLSAAGLLPPRAAQLLGPLLRPLLRVLT